MGHWHHLPAGAGCVEARRGDESSKRGNLDNPAPLAQEGSEPPMLQVAIRIEVEPGVVLAAVPRNAEPDTQGALRNVGGRVGADVEPSIGQVEPGGIERNPAVEGSPDLPGARVAPDIVRLGAGRDL